MKIIDGENSVLGRIASFAAKESLKGEEIIILNCDKIIITGNKKDIEKDFKEKRGRVGTIQKGPKHSRNIEKIVKRVIRGMLPDHRTGKGREAFKRIRCYLGEPAEYKSAGKIKIDNGKKIKFKILKDILR